LFKKKFKLILPLKAMLLVIARSQNLREENVTKTTVYEFKTNSLNELRL
jgi:hypothetical protein